MNFNSAQQVESTSYIYIFEKLTRAKRAENLIIYTHLEARQGFVDVKKIVIHTGTRFRLTLLYSTGYDSLIQQTSPSGLKQPIYIWRICLYYIGVGWAPWCFTLE